MRQDFARLVFAFRGLARILMRCGIDPERVHLWVAKTIDDFDLTDWDLLETQIEGVLASAHLEPDVRQDLSAEARSILCKLSGRS